MAIRINYSKDTIMSLWINMGAVKLQTPDGYSNRDWYLLTLVFKWYATAAILTHTHTHTHTHRYTHTHARTHSVQLWVQYLVFTSAQRGSFREIQHADFYLIPSMIIFSADSTVSPGHVQCDRVDTEPTQTGLTQAIWRVSVDWLPEHCSRKSI